MTHIVNSLRFEADCASEAQAVQVRNEFAHKCQPMIPALIDRVCSQYVNDTEWLRIDSITIDMGDFDAGNFEKLFTERLLFQLEIALSKKLTEIPAEERERLAETAAMETLLFFLQYGVLPWWVDEAQLNLEQLLERVGNDQAASLKKMLLANKKNPVIWKRIAYQFSDDGIRRIISLFETFERAEIYIAKQLEAYLQDSPVKIEPAVEAAKQLPRLRIFILENALLFFEYPLPAAETVAMIDKKMQELFPAEQEENGPGLPEPGILIAEVPAVEEPIDPVVEKSVDQLLAAALSEGFEEDTAGQPEKFMVKNAGLVIAAPFLKQLFTELKYLESGEWKDREASYRAVHLLHFIATGALMQPEYNLTLEKVLCGVDIAEPIPRSIVLADHEKGEAESMLHALIQNWAAVKNSSVAGLQETFLKRDGMLRRKELNWLLNVERKTFDVLLDKIPWGYSSLVFSWNPGIVFVEW